MLAAMMRTTALFCMLAAVRASTLSLVPSTQTGFFKRGSDVGPMNPHSYRPNEFVTNDFIFEGLVAWDPTSNGADGVAGTSDDGVVGKLAESWTVADVAGKMEITFALKPNVAFHDGEKWNAAAAKINFDHILGGTTRRRAGFHDWFGLGAAIESWTAVDDMTFKVTFKYHYEAALRELTTIRPFRFASPLSLPPLDKKELSCNEWKSGAPRVHGNWGPEPRVTYTCRGVKAPIGTGPYKVIKKVIKTAGSSASRDLPATKFNETCYGNDPCTYGEEEYVSEVVFEKVVDYHGDVGKAFDTVIVKSYKTQEDIKAALLDGTLDLAYGAHALTPSAFVKLATQGGSNLTAHQSDTNLNTRHIVLNSAGALNTIAKRKFIMRQIDRKPLQEGELAEEDPAETVFDPSLPYCDITGLSPIATLAASDNTVTASDFEGISLRLLYIKDMYHQNMVASKVIADLATAGIAVTPLPKSKDEYNALMNTWLGEDGQADTPDDVNGTISFDMAYSETWGPPYDPTSKLFDMTYEWGSGEADSVATRNLDTLQRATFITDVRGLSQITDVTARTAKYKTLLTTLHNEAIFFPITRKRNIAVVNSRVSGFSFGSTEFDIPIASMYPTPPPSKIEVSSIGLSDGAKAGIAVGAVFGVFLLVFASYLVIKEKQGAPVFMPIAPEEENLVSKPLQTSGGPPPGQAALMQYAPGGTRYPMPPAPPGSGMA